ALAVDDVDRRAVRTEEVRGLLGHRVQQRIEVGDGHELPSDVENDLEALSRAAPVLAASLSRASFLRGGSPKCLAPVDTGAAAIWLFSPLALAVSSHALRARLGPPLAASASPPRLRSSSSLVAAEPLLARAITRSWSSRGRARRRRRPARGAAGRAARTRRRAC